MTSNVTSQLDPWDLPPLETGCTLAFDQIAGRSDNGVLILRSVRVFRSVLSVTLEVFPAPELATDDWFSLIAKGRPVLSSEPVVTATLNYADGRIRKLEPWEAGGTQRYYRAELWGVIDVARTPIGVRLTWLDEVDSGEIALQPERIAEAARASEMLW